MELNLPEIRKGCMYALPHFPTVMQAMIFRCWEMIPAERIAKVLETTEENVKKLAFGMGLKEQENLDEWIQNGYISIIRNTWQILPYDQLLELLGWDEERLNYVLKEDDFLNVKLGFFKFDCPRVVYRPLTPEEEKATELVKKAVEENISDIPANAVPFKFFDKEYKPLPRENKQGVAVTNDWCIINNAGNGVSVCVADFKAELEKNFGVTLGETGNGKIILFKDIITDDEEYHEIEISDDRIEIHGSTDEAILRALYYLLQIADDNGAPVFEKQVYKRKTAIKTRYIYSFSGLYSDVLDVDNSVSFPDDLLIRYAKYGINGVWIQAIVYKLVPFTFDESISKGWQKRIENLNNLIERAKRYGIKVYLYINEPRGMPWAFFDKHPELKGTVFHDGLASLCTSNKEVQKYLRDAMVSLCTMAPGIGGFFNICMSENLTNCYSRSDIREEDMCPVCKNRPAEDVAAEVLGIMANAVRETNPKIKFFAYTWAWEREFTAEQIGKLISKLPENVIILNVSENWKEYTIGGVKGNIVDYSLSIPGPGEWSKSTWKQARERCLETAAKVQINNSWECSTAPFLPVYDTVLTHIENLKKEKVQHLMLSWTLGGYPSENIKIAASTFFEDENSTENAYETVLRNSYGAYADTVRKAATAFSNAFSEFPFSVYALYMGPQNLGSAALLHKDPTGLGATMTCYPYDDINTWSKEYPHDVYENQFKKLSEKWAIGLEIVEAMPVCEFKDMVVYGYTLFKSSYNQIRFLTARKGDDEACVEIIKEEIELAKKAYEILGRNSAVGYEAANHYYVNKTMLAEKIVSCTKMLEDLKKKPE